MPSRRAIYPPEVLGVIKCLGKRSPNHVEGFDVCLSMLLSIPRVPANRPMQSLTFSG